MKGNTPAIIILIILFSPILFQIVVVFKQVRLRKLSMKGFRSFLKKVALLTIVGSIVVLTLNHTNFLNYRSPIPFSKIDSITFEDFRGLEFFRKKHNGNPRYAYIVTSIKSEIKENEVHIESFFHPSRSYVYNNNVYSGELLNHELYHFRITELFARMVRKEVSQEAGVSKDDIKSILKKNERKEQTYQAKYDSDSYHSYVLKEQKRYETEIDSLISSLHEFSQPIILRNVKF